MNQDAYSESLRILREQSVAAPEQAEATRLRLQRSLVQRAARRRVLRSGGLALAAALATSTALAYYVGMVRGPRAQRLDAVSRELSRESLQARVIQFELVPRVSVAQQTPAPASPVSERNLSVAPARTRAPRPQTLLEQTPSIAASAPPSTLSAGEREALYLTAHRLHFRGAPAAALAAWDAYLATGAGGARELEARYNRAVVLTRLGRTAEAIATLTPFARGEHGTFRKVDAALLIERLTTQ